jgi:NitT/TauT family transport system substrate-binding protein
MGVSYRATLSLLAGCLIGCALAVPANAQNKIRFGWCSNTYSVAIAQFAVAQKKGWFKDNHIDFSLFTFGGSIDCARNIATGELDVALASPEPLGILALQGVKEKIFYSNYRRSIFGLAVSEDSGFKTYADMKGQTIGVTSMSSVGVTLARAVATMAGLNPQTDIRIVVTGEPAQTAVLIRRGEVKILSQFDTYYTQIERAGLKLRRIPDPELKRFPSNAFVALESTIEKRRADLVNFARAVAMGTAYCIAHPREAIEMTYEVYPSLKPSSGDIEQAITNDMAILNDRIESWRLDKPEVEQWGSVDVNAFQAYFDWLQKFDLLKGKVDAAQLTTDELIADINKFDKKLVTQK